MKPLVSVCVALAMAGLSVTAFAQVTQTYQYDASGRLTGVTTAGAAGTNTAAYIYDDADNRASRSQTGTAAYATLSPRDRYDRLRLFQSQGPEQALSPDIVILALERTGDVAFAGWRDMGQRSCFGTDLPPDRWQQASSSLISRNRAVAVPSPGLTIAPAEAEPLLDGEPTIRSGGFTRWSAMLNSERCS